MKFLRSFWVIAFLALTINVVMTLFLFTKYQEKLLVPFLAAPAQAQAHAPKPVDDSTVYWSFRTGEIENLADDLRHQKSALVRRELELKAIESRMLIEKDEIKRLQEEFQQVHEVFSARIIEVQQSELKNLKTLSNTYASLTPQAAVAILVEMDDDLSAKILSMMKPEVVAAIFEEMATAGAGSQKGASPKRVADLSNRLRLQLINKQK